MKQTRLPVTKFQGEMWFDKLTTLRKLEGRMISCIDQPDVIKNILQQLGLWEESQAPPERLPPPTKEIIVREPDEEGFNMISTKGGFQCRSHIVSIQPSGLHAWATAQMTFLSARKRPGFHSR